MISIVTYLCNKLCAFVLIISLVIIHQHCCCYSLEEEENTASAVCPALSLENVVDGQTTELVIIESNITVDLIIDKTIHFATNTSAKNEKKILAEVCLEQYNNLSLLDISCSSDEGGSRTMNTIFFVDLVPVLDDDGDKDVKDSDGNNSSGRSRRSLQSRTRTRWRYFVRGQCRNCRQSTSFLCDDAVEALCGADGSNSVDGEGTPSPTVTVTTATTITKDDYQQQLLKCCNPVPENDFITAVNETIQLLHNDNQALGLISVNDAKEDVISTTAKIVTANDNSDNDDNNNNADSTPSPTTTSASTCGYGISILNIILVAIDLFFTTII